MTAKLLSSYVEEEYQVDGYESIINIRYYHYFYVDNHQTSQYEVRVNYNYESPWESIGILSDKEEGLRAAEEKIVNWWNLHED